MSRSNLAGLQERISSRWFLIGIVVLSVALLTRFPGLWPSLWGDELKAVSDAQGSVGDSIRSQGFHPPLYYMLLNIWMRLGTGDAWIRSLSMLLGLFTVGTVGLIAKELGGRSAGWIAAVLAAITHPLCWTSYEARNYALHILLGALAWLFLILALKRDGRLNWVLFAVCLAGTWYSFYYGFYVAIGLGIFFLAMRPNKRQFIFFSMAALGAIVIFLPWIPVLLEQMGRVESWADRAVPPSWTILGLIRLSAHAVALHGPWNPFGTTTASFLGLPTTETIFLILLMIFGLFIFRRWPFHHDMDIDPWSRRGIWATLMAGMSYLMASHYAALAGTYVWLKYLTFIGIFWSVSAALILQCMRRRPQIILLVVLVVAGTVGGGYRAFHRTTPEWREAVTLVETEFIEGDNVIANNLGLLAFHHYGLQVLAAGVIHDARWDGRLVEPFSGDGRVWVLSNARWGESEDTFRKTVSEHLIRMGYQRVNVWNFNAKVYWGVPLLTVSVYEHHQGGMSLR